MKQQLVNQFNMIGLSRISNDLAELANRSFRMKSEEAEEKKISIGRSKFGGMPDLPKDLSWPKWRDKSLSFICQLNLQELEKYNIENLPKSGVLYFFYDAEEQPWGFDSNDRGCCKVLVYNGNVDGDKLNRIKFPNDLEDECKFEAAVINFSQEITMPLADSLYMKKLRLNHKELSILSKLEDSAEEMLDEEIIHRLLGYADVIQGEMEEDCCLVNNGIYCGDESGYKNPKAKDIMKNAEDWKLLLQVDSQEDIGFEWGDIGRLYFWIHKDDLKNLNFDNVWVILQCC